MLPVIIAYAAIAQVQNTVAANIDEMPDNFHQRKMSEFVLKVKTETFQYCPMMRGTQADQILNHGNPVMNILLAIKQGTSGDQSPHAVADQVNASNPRITLDKFLQGVGQTVTIGRNPSSGIVVQIEHGIAVTLRQQFFTNSFIFVVGPVQMIHTESMHKQANPSGQLTLL